MPDYDRRTLISYYFSEINQPDFRPGPLIILMHGWPQRSNRSLVGSVPDQRGYGMSDCPPNVEDYKIKTHGLATALGYDEYALMIESYRWVERRSPVPRSCSRRSRPFFPYGMNGALRNTGGLILLLGVRKKQKLKN